MSPTAGEGLLVTDSHTKTTFRHTVYLANVYGDSPAQKKLSKWLSHAAYLGCGYCRMSAVRDGRNMAYYGYRWVGSQGGHRGWGVAMITLCPARPPAPSSHTCNP